jgi:hypothetical protein
MFMYGENLDAYYLGNWISLECKSTLCRQLKHDKGYRPKGWIINMS